MCDSQQEALDALHQIMIERTFGDAGAQVVVEKRLTGREISVLAFCDGKTVMPMPVARDHKRALDGDLGLNTGGMGAFAPTSDVPQHVIDEAVATVLQPAVDGMAARGTPYVGVLYAGLMLTDEGISTLEFNCRFGDPETQVILPLLETDLVAICDACIDGRLGELDIQWNDGVCATVVVASGGYPEAYEKGLPITGLDWLDAQDDLIVFHAGTRKIKDSLVTSGGRVLGVTCVSDTLEDALDTIYDGIQHLHFQDMQYRTDIGRVGVNQS